MAKSVSVKGVDKPTRLCSKCKKDPGEWMQAVGKSGSWWEVKCQHCGNSMSSAAIIDLDFLRVLKGE